MLTNPNKGKWFKFNDTVVEEFEMTDATVEQECFGGVYKAKVFDSSKYGLLSLVFDSKKYRQCSLTPEVQTLVFDSSKYRWWSLTPVSTDSGP